MNALRIVVAVWLVMVVSGCTRYLPIGLPAQETIPRKSSSIFDFDLDTLGEYNLHLAGLPPSDRIDECAKLTTIHTVDKKSIGVLLHLAYVTALTPECGGTQKAVEIFESVQSIVKDSALLGFLGHQTKLLQDINSQSEQISKQKDLLDQSQKQTQLFKNKLKQKDTELAELRAKLDALKSIEKTFHQRNGGSR